MLDIWDDSLIHCVEKIQRIRLTRNSVTRTQARLDSGCHLV